MECHTAKTAYVSELAPEELTSFLKEEGYDVRIIRKTDKVYSEVSAHPDIYMTRLGAGSESPLFHGDSEKLGFRYPDNIIYNAAICGRYFIHNLKYSSPELISSAEKYVWEKYSQDMVTIHTKQGYTKCNIVVVDETHIITEDEGIRKSVELAMYRERNAIGRGKGEERLKARDDFDRRKIKVLKIAPGYVHLPGFPNGFIGGASGRVGDTIVFNGDISKHPDYDKINDFIKDAGLGIKYFDYPLTDIGSIITEEIL